MTERTAQQDNGEVGICHVCGATFDTQEQLAAHLIDEHDGELLPVDDA